ncbi:MAG TPA: hypothetical protein VGI99_10635 [Gemmataceae bacterium]|jgi:hypothetical protein
MNEQRNPYQGRPLRPWLSLDFIDENGEFVPLKLIADTGSPHAIVLQESIFERLVIRYTRRIKTNFGKMRGGWIRLSSRALGLVELVEAFGSDDMARMAMRSHLDFVGVVGLQILRRGEYGGDHDSFWIRTP